MLLFSLGQQVFWHSSAHILGEAMERHYGGCLCYGPPIEEGFYYDMSIEDRQVSSNDFSSLETLVKKIIKEKQPFVRLEMKREDLLKMFDVRIYVYTPLFLTISIQPITPTQLRHPIFSQSTVPTTRTI